MVKKDLSIIRGDPGTFQDESENIQSTGVLIDEDTYDTGSFIDRDYDVRPLSNFSILVENIHASAQSLDYTIQTTTKSYELMSELADADFVSDGSHTDITVAQNAKGAVFSLDLKDTSITGVRLRAKRTTTLEDATMRADVRGR